MPPKLRAMLVQMGMKENASDDEARSFMKENGIAAIDVTGDSGEGNNSQRSNTPDPSNDQPSAAAEQQRVLELIEIGQEHGMADEARTAIKDGITAEKFRGIVLERKYKATPVDIPSEIGMSRNEVQQYSLRKALLAYSTNDWGQAGLEREASDEVAKQRGKQPQGFFMPFDVAASRNLDMGLVQSTRAAMSVGNASTGGALVDTSTMWQSMVDLLRNANVLGQLGVQYLNGLVGDVVIPKKISGASYFHVAEGVAVGESDLKFSGLGLTPHTVGTFVPYTRKLLLQGAIGVEQMIRADLTEVLSLAIQDMAIYGTGTNGQPLGLLNNKEIEVLPIGANGGALTRSHIIQMATKVEVNNALMNAVAYLTNAKVKGTLQETFINENSDKTVWKDDNTMNGYKGVITNAVPSNLKKGNSGAVCSGLSFGDFSRLLIGTWSGLDFKVNPYSEDKAGNIRVTVHMDYDIANRQPKAFCNIKDALTNV